MTITTSSSVLTLRDVNKSFGQTHIIRGANLELKEGEKHAFIGPNGAGKSTLFHLISGNIKPTSGEILLGDASIAGLDPEKINHMGLARSFQITNIFMKLSVYENLRLGVMQRFGVQFNFWRSIAGFKKINAITDQLLEQIRLTKYRDTLAGELSYSEQRSIEIGMTLASDPKVILLDEPMAGMSREETDYTVDLLRELTEGRTLMIVEHDMDVVFNLCDRISVLVYGQVIATDTPEGIRHNAQVQEAYLGTEVSQ